MLGSEFESGCKQNVNLDWNPDASTHIQLVDWNLDLVQAGLESMCKWGFYLGPLLIDPDINPLHVCIVDSIPVYDNIGHFEKQQ